MSTEFPFVEIPEELFSIIGEPDPGTRLYRQVGSREESGKWFGAICDYVGQTVSPGGVVMYVKASRSAIYKRLKEGRLSAFCFHVLKPEMRIFGGRYYRSSPFIYIPVEEAKAWGKEQAARQARGEDLTADIYGDEPESEACEILEWDSAWRKKKIKEMRGKPLKGG
jgi:hypothetical protein